MNNKLFKIIKDNESSVGDGGSPGKIVGAFNKNTSKSAKLIPVQTGVPIDVVNDFKWTKTSRNSEGRKNTPAVELEEFEVVVPAFFSNLNVAIQVLRNTAEGGADALKAFTGPGGIGGSVSSLIGGAIESVGRNMSKLSASGRETFGDVDSGAMPRYLKAYENLYGIKRTKFKYSLPYLENEYKSVSNNWTDSGGSNLESLLGSTAANFITKDLFTKVGTGIGIDYSKSFAYGGTAPSHNIHFYLDNTKDSNYSGSHIPNYETNFRLIYLLLYQNLPNRVNRITYVPPVIYRSKLPGVFSYRWSYLNNVTVNMVGVRRTKTINDFIDGRPSQVVIPEGYEVSLTIQSLVPETQNLYFDAFNNGVVVTEEKK